MVAVVTIAVTGATGFIGSHFVEMATQAGHRVRALTRRPQPPRHGVEWIEGSLADPDSLRDLVSDCNSLVHLAGVLNARRAEDFERGNVEGTLAMLAAATAAGITRFVHVSSLAAREPQLSMYGRSKARSEELVQRSGLDWVIVRPPAVYGPGDRETLELFRMAQLRLMLLPPSGRLSVIHADDLARLLLALSQHDFPQAAMIEPDDGRAGGWSHRQFARAIGEAVGRKHLALSMPRAMLQMGAVVDQLVRRERAKLSADRAAYFSHSDWVVSPDRQAPAELWRPQVPTAQGLEETAAWYRLQGWL